MEDSVQIRSFHLLLGDVNVRRVTVGFGRHKTSHQPHEQQ